VIQSITTALKEVASGTASSERKIWSFQLSDKVEPVSTHIHWAIRNCNGDAEKLKSSLLNIVDHYKNITKLERPYLSLRRSCPWGNFFKNRFHRFNTVPSIVLIYSISFFTYIFIDGRSKLVTKLSQFQRIFTRPLEIVMVMRKS
jgi:hypothetical protein